MKYQTPQIKYLLSQLNKQLEEANRAPLGLAGTYKKFAKCSKTVAELCEWGLTVDEAFDQAEALNHCYDENE